MVKLNFVEQFAIYVLSFIGTIFIPVDYENPLVVILLIIIWLSVSNIIVKLIKGKDVLNEEEKKDKEREERINKKIENFSLSKWWRKQKEWVKIIIIVFCVFAVTLILVLLDI